MLKNGRTLRTDAKLILRGISEFNRILPGQLRLLSANAVLTALAPYIAIVLSAKIITELTGARDINKLVLYVLLATGMTFLLTAVGAKLKAKIAVGYSLLFRAHEIHLNSKSYDIDYAKLEDPDFRALRDQVTGNISSTGAGMASLYWDTEVVVTNLCSVIVACILSGGIFTARGSGFKGVFAVTNSGWAALILAVLVLLCAVVSAKMTAKYFDVSFDVFKNGAKYSRYGRFYLMEYLSENKAAKAVRIFRQKDIIVNESQKR